MLVTYVATWSGWLLTDDGYYRHCRADPNGPAERTPVIGALSNLWDYHRAAYGFHTSSTTTHKYQSWPWQWLLLGRPVAFYWTGDGGCGAPSCAAEILLLGTPLLWWSFLPALAGDGLARHRPAGLARPGDPADAWPPACCPGSGTPSTGRTMFSFYAAPALPFLVLAVVYVLGAIATPAAPAPPGRSGLRAAGAAATRATTAG